ncbi:MAG: GTPase [Patescibacteria group bacterium]
MLADIPGLIEGASSGKGLGSRFLKHIERTKFLVHLVSAEQDKPAEAYSAIRNELATFGRGLSEKPQTIFVKISLRQPRERAQNDLSTACEPSSLHARWRQ